MIEWFPHERAPLPRTHLRYVDLDAVLSDGKVERESKAPGFVVLFYGEETDVLFMVGGEPITAARFSAGSRGIVPLAAVRRRAQAEREWAGAAFYHAPEPQLRAMYASAARVPDLSARELDADRSSALFSRARERAFSGVVELLEERKAHYLVFEGGLPVHGFFADQRRSGDVSSKITLASRLDVLFQPQRLEGVTLFTYPAVDRLPVQAPAGLLHVYSQLVAAAVDRTAEALGRGTAIRCFQTALERAAEKQGALADYSLSEDGRLTGDSTASAAELTDAIAALLFDALTAADRAGATDPASLLESVTHADRFVLQAHSFFDRFPWPLRS